MALRKKTTNRLTLFRTCHVCGQTMITTADTPFIRQLNNVNGKKQATVYFCSEHCKASTYRHLFDGCEWVRRKEREAARDTREKNRRYQEEHAEELKEKRRQKAAAMPPEERKRENAYRRKQRALHKDEINAARREQRAANREETNRKNREYKHNHPVSQLPQEQRDRINARRRAWRAANKDRINAERNRKRAENREEVNRRQREYRARKKAEREAEAAGADTERTEHDISGVFGNEGGDRAGQRV